MMYQSPSNLALVPTVSSQIQNLRSGYSFDLGESILHIGDICNYGT